MRRGFHRKSKRRGVGHAAVYPSKTQTEDEMTSDEFENLDDQQADLRIADRFRAFALNGLGSGLSLTCAAHPEVDEPIATDGFGFLEPAA